MCAPATALVRIEGSYFGQARILVHPDVSVRRQLRLFAILKLVGQAQKIRIRVPFKDIHAQQGRSTDPGPERIMESKLFGYQQLQLAKDLFLYFLQTFQPWLEEKTVLFLE